LDSPPKAGVAQSRIDDLREECSARDLALGDERFERGRDGAFADPPARGHHGGGEGAMRPRVTGNEARERVFRWLEKDMRQARIENDAEGIAITRGIFDRDEARLTCEARAKDSLLP